MGEKRSFRNRLVQNLAYRIMSVILVTFVPLCAVTIAIAYTALYTSSERLHDANRRQTEVNLNRLEMDILRLEDYAEEFVDEYMEELNAAGGFSDELIPYDMISDLQRLFSHTELKGAVYLVDLSSGRCMVKSEDALYKSTELETIQALLSDSTAAGFEGFSLEGRELMRREYSYLNARTGFLVDIPANIERLVDTEFSEEISVYVETSTGVLRYFYGGTIEPVTGNFVDLSHPGLREKQILWQAERLPLAVSICYSRGLVLGGIPTAVWGLAAIAILCIFLTPLIWYVLKKDVLFPIEKLTGALQEMRSGNESYRIDEHDKRYAAEMLYLFESFDKAAEEVQRSKEKDVKMVKAELDNLRLQVNPHMLLNSYNMIFALAQSKKFDTIQDYSLHLVNYFRYVLRKTDELVSVQQEMDFILNFIDIQQIRFPNAFRFTYKVGDGCEEAMIPPLLIENFVENSLKYALIPGQVVEVMVDIQHIGRQLHIAVSDTGNGIKPEVLEALNKGEPYVDPAGSKHIGIWNCMRRVEVFYGERASLEITSQRNNGTSIILSIPYKEGQNHEAVDCRR